MRLKEDLSYLKRIIVRLELEIDGKLSLKK